MFKRKSKTIQYDISDDALIYHYRQTTREQRGIIDKQDEVLKRILELTEMNTYGNERAFLDKIKELAKTGIQH